MYTTRLAADALEKHGRLAESELFERILERIHCYFLKLLRNEDEAQECLQETLVRLERSLREGKYDPDRSFNTWLWLKARTVYAQWCRSRERGMAPLPSEQLVQDRKNTQQALEDQMDAQVLLEKLRTELGGETYEAFVLYYEGGLTKSELAEVLGRDPKTVNKRLAVAHGLLKRLLKDSSGSHALDQYARE